MVMSSWRKARNALGLRVCVSPSTVGGAKDAIAVDGETHSTSSASALLSPRFSSKLRSSTQNTCAICLEMMKAGHGHALFTAECSHSFHFSCIASNVRYGNLVCPVCRATWKEVPWQAPALKLTKKHEQLRGATNSVHLRHVQSRSSSLSPRRRVPAPYVQSPMREAEEQQQRLEPVLRMLDESIANFQLEERGKQLAELKPSRFDDDEELESGEIASDANDHNEEATASSVAPLSSTQAMQITALPEESEVAFNEERENLTILVHVKAAAARDEEKQLANMLGSSAAMLDGGQRRAAVDLVAVLDVSGSMAGTKLALLKRAMRLVVRSLGSADRLSVVAFALRARRVMPLQRMTEEGRRAALEALESLTCTGGTSIADGLRKGTAILQQRRQKNAVATIMLLSDGQDSFTMQRLQSTAIPTTNVDINSRNAQFQIPVHTFGLGVDHDASAMHTISEESGGTFSFIQGEGLVQDAFAQCLGGLLSVVALGVEVEVEVINPATAQLLRLEAGSYTCQTIAMGRHARVDLGDLYAHEERDLLVNIKLPSLSAPSDGEVLAVRARYYDPISGTCFYISPPTQVFMQRPSRISASSASPCIEVDRHRNRLQAAHAIVEARNLADVGNLSAAQRILEAARGQLQSSAAMRNGDTLSAALDAELGRIQSNMGNRHVYQTCGRAYALAAESSHLRQRATTRGGSRSEEVASEGYRTPSMNTILVRSSSPSQASPPASPRGVSPPSPRRRHILTPRPGSRLARLASFDSVIRP